MAPRSQPVPIPRLLHIAIQLAEGLAAAHDAGIVHRDLKPDNIFLIPRGGDKDFVKILDFGIAKVKSDAEQAPGVALTRTGSLVGTPLYMSPEQARGEKVIDARTDIWSLGACAFTAMTAQIPFEGEVLGDIVRACDQVVRERARLRRLPLVVVRLELAEPIVEQRVDHFGHELALDRLDRRIGGLDHEALRLHLRIDQADGLFDDFGANGFPT